MTIVLCGLSDLRKFEDFKQYNIAVSPLPWLESVPALAPQYAMVGAVKRHRGEPTAYVGKPITVTEYVNKYRTLLLKTRAREVAAWARQLQPDTNIAMACYCKRVPDDWAIPASDGINDETCQRWFCHRLLVYYMLQSWRPDIEVRLV